MLEAIAALALSTRARSLRKHKNKNLRTYYLLDLLILQMHAQFKQLRERWQRIPALAAR